jgi:GNAT superfamily N-acetyltransferase
VTTEALFATRSAQCVELTREGIPRLQRFLEENPEYDLTVNGEAPHADEAKEEFESMPPPEWPLGRKWYLAFEDRDRAMIAVADVLSDLFVAHVWHIGLFIVATRLHGSGVAHELYEGLEQWMRSRGARWSRLGVVAGNARAERFWAKMGYIEVRRRHDIAMGRRRNDLRVMSKPLAGGSIDEYLTLVSRDRPVAN